MNIAIAQMGPAVGKVEENLSKHLELLKKAKDMGAEVVIFPELALTGYELYDLVPDVAIKEGHPIMEKLKEASRILPFFTGFVLEEDDLFFNAAGFFREGKLVHIHRKVFLPNYSMFEEKRFFAEGDRFRAFYDGKLGRVGILICYDYLHPSSSYVYFLQKVDLLVVLSASPARGYPQDGFPSIAMWENMSKVVSRHFTVYVAYANRVGFDGGMAFGGGSHAYSPTGEEILRLKDLEEDLGIFTYERKELRRARVLFPALRDERPRVIYREIRRILNED